MGTLFVVASQPSIGLRLNLIDRIEQTRIEHLGAKASVEAFDEGSLVGLAGLDERQPDTLIPGLVHKGSEVISGPPYSLTASGLP